MPRAKISLDDLAELCTKALELSELNQPLSVFEIHVLASRLTEHDFSDTHTRNALQLAVDAGFMQARTETPDERKFRAEGRPVGNQLSTLYWLSSLPADLPRTIASPVKGVRLGDGSQFADSQRRSRQRKRAARNARKAQAQAQPATAPAPKPVTDVRTTVERLVQLELEMKQLADERERLLSELG